MTEGTMIALIGAVVAICSTVSTLIIVMLNNKQALRMEELKNKVEILGKDVNGHMTKLLAAKDAESAAKQEAAKLKGKEEGAKDSEEKENKKNKWGSEPRDHTET